MKSWMMIGTELSFDEIGNGGWLSRCCVQNEGGRRWVLKAASKEI
jgi:hypothetical protein